MLGTSPLRWCLKSGWPCFKGLGCKREEMALSIARYLRDLFIGQEFEAQVIFYYP